MSKQLHKFHPKAPGEDKAKLWFSFVVSKYPEDKDDQKWCHQAMAMWSPTFCKRAIINSVSIDARTAAVTMVTEQKDSPAMSIGDMQKKMLPFGPSETAGRSLTVVERQVRNVNKAELSEADTLELIASLQAKLKS